jgi:crotonobetainyl-CoA:carnitine CoA-transferase CaiB-like acyl-CoA transferase
MSSPLEGVRVLDLSRVLAGPWAGQVLADLGAEVIKVERPDVGDDTRAWGPPFLETNDAEGSTRESAYYLCTNRGKKSITVDLSKVEGQAIVRGLAAKSDVLIENFKAGGLSNFGLGWDEMRVVNPRLIFCSVTGFGQTGPYRDKLGYDFLIQGMGGLMGVTGAPDGEPMKAGVAVTDLFTGMYCATAILGALLERERSQQGQQIDIALFDVQIATLANQVMSYLVSGNQPPRLGNGHPSIVPYQSFVTADATILVAVGNDGQFARFAQAIGCAELSADARYARNENRVANRTRLVATIAARLITETTAFWISKLDPIGVPCGPVNGFADIDRDPHVIARNIFKTVHHARAGKIRSVASPMRFSRSVVRDGAAAPPLGSDSDAILSNVLGASAEDICRWRKLKVI